MALLESSFFCMTLFNQTEQNHLQRVGKLHIKDDWCFLRSTKCGAFLCQTIERSKVLLHSAERRDRRRRRGFGGARELPTLHKRNRNLPQRRATNRAYYNHHLQSALHDVLSPPSTTFCPVIFIGTCTRFDKGWLPFVSSAI